MGGYKLSERFCELVTKQQALKPASKDLYVSRSMDLGIKKIEVSLFLAASASLVEQRQHTLEPWARSRITDATEILGKSRLNINHFLPLFPRQFDILLPLIQLDITDDSPDVHV